MKMNPEDCDICLFYNICPYNGPCDHYTALDFDSNDNVADRCFAEEFQNLVEDDFEEDGQ